MQFGQIKRREFITLLGGAVAWPLAARAQQPAMPVVGFLDPGSAAERTQQVAAFRKGLAEAGYQEGQDMTLEFRWAEGQYGRFGELAANLVRRRVSVIAIPASGPPHSRSRPLPPQSRSCSVRAVIRSSKGWSPASIDPAAMPPASTSSASKPRLLGAISRPSCVSL